MSKILTDDSGKDWEVVDAGTLDKLEEQVRAGKAVAVKYNQLLLAVETKFEGKSRHEIALLYIKQVEAFNEGVEGLEKQPAITTFVEP